MDLGLGAADVVVVGSGFYGLTVAERAARDGARVAVLERRAHLGGNAWSYPDPETGIEIHAYGSHIFHTSNRRVWDYVNQFGQFNDYRHHVWTVHDGKVYPMPISLATMTQFFGERLTPRQARERLAAQASELGGRAPANFEEKAISLVGRPLYEAFIRGYTSKQWQTDPTLLPERIITRLPVRFDYNTRYFSDTWEGIPEAGYGALLKRMASTEGVTVHCGVDWFDVCGQVHNGTPVVYTGPIDRYFSYRAGRLGWRTLDLKTEVFAVNDYQGTSVVNYADIAQPQTRIHEFKHFQPERWSRSAKTVVMTEFSRWADASDEPYYPVDAPLDRERLSVYRELAEREPDVHFGGRLGSYQYLDMHMAIGAALTSYDNGIAHAIAAARGARSRPGSRR
jgi:UDP-galactopyranose mutase